MRLCDTHPGASCGFLLFSAGGTPVRSIDVTEPARAGIIVRKGPALLKLLPAAVAIATIAPTVSAGPTLFEQGPPLSSGTVASDSIDPAMFTQGDNFSLAQSAVVTGVTFSGEYQLASGLRLHPQVAAHIERTLGVA